MCILPNRIPKNLVEELREVMNIYKITADVDRICTSETTVLGETIIEAIYTLTLHLKSKYDKDTQIEFIKIELLTYNVVIPKGLDYNIEQKAEIASKAIPSEDLEREIDLTE